VHSSLPTPDPEAAAPEPDSVEVSKSMGKAEDVREACITNSSSFWHSECLCAASNVSWSQAKPSYASSKPSHAKSCQAMPIQAKPCQGIPEPTKPSQGNPPDPGIEVKRSQVSTKATLIQAKASHAKPIHAKLSQGKPSWAKLSHAKHPIHAKLSYAKHPIKPSIQSMPRWTMPSIQSMPFWAKVSQAEPSGAMPSWAKLRQGKPCLASNPFHPRQSVLKASFPLRFIITIISINRNISQTYL
jgi:hypothetical protein